jgi:hypothetical protein
MFASKGTAPELVEAVPLMMPGRGSVISAVTGDVVKRFKAVASPG